VKIYFILGTKAQFIKTIPVINAAIKSKLEVTLYETGQHAEKATDLIKKIYGSFNHVKLSNNLKDIGTYTGLFKFAFFSLFKIIFTSDKAMKNKFCIVHGDTLSTLLGAFIVKRNKGILVLLEAGKSFPGMMNHFPESFVRYYVAKLSNVLIVNHDDHENQLKDWSVKGKILKIHRNTIYDSLSLVNLDDKKKSNLVTVSIHRTENINSKENMSNLVKIIKEINKNYDINWYLHIPTKNKLKSFKLIKELKVDNIFLSDLIKYDEFLNKLNSSEFVITDGDGVVEECQILGIPTLVWRYEHLDSNYLFKKDNSLFLSEFDLNKCKYFFENYINFKRNRLYDVESPSSNVIEKLLAIQNY
tara:strand:- start:10016 stop:11092 length:1077 start_codon:yes stop_codon:yes gene_type:complete